MKVWVVYLSGYGQSSPENVEIFMNEEDARKEFEEIFDDMTLMEAGTVMLENPNYAYSDNIHLYLFEYEVKGSTKNEHPKLQEYLPDV